MEARLLNSPPSVTVILHGPAQVDSFSNQPWPALPEGIYTNNTALYVAIKDAFGNAHCD